jgi:hypothetical protein
VRRRGGASAVDLAITLQELNGGQATLLCSPFDETAHGFAKLFFPALLASLRREERRNLQLIKKWVESIASRFTTPPAQQALPGRLINRGSASIAVSNRW